MENLKNSFPVWKLTDRMKTWHLEFFIAIKLSLDLFLGTRHSKKCKDFFLQGEIAAMIVGEIVPKEERLIIIEQ